MRAFKVSVRIRRLPVKSIRAITACGFSEGCCEAAPLVVTEGRVTEDAAGESKEGVAVEEEEDGEAPVWRSCCAAGRIAACNSNNAATQIIRPSKTPNGKQTLLCAAVEVLKAAPPNASCFSPAEPGVGRLCGDPDRAGPSVVRCVRFVSE